MKFMENCQRNLFSMKCSYWKTVGVVVVVVDSSFHQSPS